MTSKFGDATSIEQIFYSALSHLHQSVTFSAVHRWMSLVFYLVSIRLRTTPSHFFHSSFVPLLSLFFLFSSMTSTKQYFEQKITLASGETRINTYEISMKKDFTVKQTKGVIGDKSKTVHLKDKKYKSKANAMSFFKRQIGSKTGADLNHYKRKTTVSTPPKKASTKKKRKSKSKAGSADGKKAKKAKKAKNDADVEDEEDEEDKADDIASNASEAEDGKVLDEGGADSDQE